MKKRILAGLVGLLFATQASAQVQLGAGQVYGNNTAARAPAQGSTVTSILDRALGSTRGAILERGASGWQIVAPSATSGLPWVGNGAGADPAYQVLGAVGGGTGLNLYAVGDLLCATGTTTLSRVADIATGNVLLSGGVGACPSYGKVTSAHITGQALTKTDDTNVTLTLGGTPASALVNAASLTLGWTGQLAVGRGGTGLSGGTNGGVPYFNSASTMASTAACTTTTTVLHGGSPPACSQVVYADIASAAIASQSNYFSGASSVLVPADQIYQPEFAVTFGATTTFDFNAFINASVTLTGNITTQTLSNVKAGKSGTIAFIQDGVGSRTTVWNTIFKFAGGVTPTLSTAASAIDVLSYSCRSATVCVAALIKDVK